MLDLLRQTVRQTDRETVRKTDRQAVRHTVSQTVRQAQANSRADRQTLESRVKYGGHTVAQASHFPRRPKSNENG